MSAGSEHITPRGEFWRGVRAALSPIVGTSMWGMVVGVAMVKSGMTVPQAIGMSIFVYAGSAQLAVLPLMMAGAPISIVLFTALVINLRFLIYSAAMAPWFNHLGVRWKLLLGYVSGDVAAAIFMNNVRNDNPRPHAHWFFLGPSAAGWWSWQASSMVGVLLGSQVPESWGLGFAGTIVLGGLAITAIINRAVLAGVITAALMSVWCAGLPLRLGLVAAVVAGITVAMGVEALTEKRS